MRNYFLLETVLYKKIVVLKKGNKISLECEEEYNQKSKDFEIPYNNKGIDYNKIISLIYNTKYSYCPNYLKRMLYNRILNSCDNQFVDDIDYYHLHLFEKEELPAILLKFGKIFFVRYNMLDIFKKRFKKNVSKNLSKEKINIIFQKSLDEFYQIIQDNFDDIKYDIEELFGSIGSILSVQNNLLPFIACCIYCFMFTKREKYFKIIDFDLLNLCMECCKHKYSATKFQIRKLKLKKDCIIVSSCDNPLDILITYVNQTYGYCRGNEYNDYIGYCVEEHEEYLKNTYSNKNYNDKNFNYYLNSYRRKKLGY